MCPAKSRDPRSYIQAVPLPLPSHQGEYILARSDVHYKSNCASPSKEEIFKASYARRLQQMKEQGYRSVNHKPYQVLGEPLHLKEKKLILHALGQDLAQSEDSSGSGSDEEGEEEKDKKDGVLIPQPSENKPPPRKFVFRRNHKNKKSLNKEISSARKMVNWVKLGHGVFTAIRKEDEERLNAEENKRLQDAERRQREWQPPNLDSSDEDTDDDLARDEDLSIFLTPSNSEGKKEVSFSRPETHLYTPATQTPLPSEQEGREAEPASSEPPSSSLLSVVMGEPGGAASTPAKSILSTASSPVVRRRRKKKNAEPPRPYTPIRSNINVDSEEEDRTSRHAIFRQLCVLNWILEAMMTEPPAAMEPITKCWNIKYKDLRQNTFCKTTVRDKRREKLVDTRWNSFVTNPGAGHLKSRTSTKTAIHGLNLTASMSLPRPGRRVSVQAGSGMTSLGQTRASSTLSQSVNQSSAESTPRREEDGAGKRESLRELGKASSTFKILDDIIESASLVGTVGKNEDNDDTASRRGARQDRSPSIASERSASATSSGQRTVTKGPALLQKHLEERDQKATRPQEKQIHTWVATTNRKLRTMSAPPKNEFKPIFPSHKHAHLPAELRSRFADVTEDKALMLHDKLEVLEKKKLWRSEEKFRAIRTNLHISAQLERMKEAARDNEESAEEKMRKKKVEEESKWFQELTSRLPGYVFSDMACAALLDKLQSMGIIESRKITPQKFLNVLTGLKPWELCLPDVSAAIEFVRERVVLMSVEDFEAWYQHEIPGISRSQSAPPNTFPT
ncbi:coiled-coil domain-containing protein 60-like [Acanthaster planci]|uniref:Coiled-coil domain-containing protein 60-like n=1 Tax=Acanthaster planci TaxID=133434 RepID=A0A8B7ZI15_ACAPL|nr:coiled-coil domain-containing protein 60-like [Acanthaster planci]